MKQRLAKVSADQRAAEQTKRTDSIDRRPDADDRDSPTGGWSNPPLRSNQPLPGVPLTTI